MDRAIHSKLDLAGWMDGADDTDNDTNINRGVGTRNSGRERTAPAEMHLRIFFIFVS